MRGSHSGAISNIAEKNVCLLPLVFIFTLISGVFFLKINNHKYKQMTLLN